MTCVKILKKNSTDTEGISKSPKHYAYTIKIIMIYITDNQVSFRTEIVSDILYSLVYP